MKMSFNTLDNLTVDFADANTRKLLRALSASPTLLRCLITQLDWYEDAGGMAACPDEPNMSIYAHLVKTWTEQR